MVFHAWMLRVCVCIMHAWFYSRFFLHGLLTVWFCSPGWKEKKVGCCLMVIQLARPSLPGVSHCRPWCVGSGYWCVSDIDVFACPLTCSPANPHTCTCTHTSSPAHVLGAAPCSSTSSTYTHECKSLYFCTAHSHLSYWDLTSISKRLTSS